MFRPTLNSSYLLPREALTGLSPSLAPLSRGVQRLSHNLYFVWVFFFFTKKKEKPHKRREKFFLFKKRAKGKRRPCPLSLTTTYGISVDFFSFSYVDVSIH